MKNSVSGLNFIQGDLMNEASLPISQFDSVSCLHALEHFGLGRYTDPLKMDGYNLGFINLVKLLKENGTLYFSVPIGKQRIEFNAHRIFAIETVMLMAKENKLRLIDFAYVNDEGALVYLDNSEFNTIKYISDNISYGCGLFTFSKN